MLLAYTTGGIFLGVLTTTPPIAVDFDIIHGDCVRGMNGMDSKSVDVVVTSPPYNIGMEYSSYDDNKAPEEYLEWCEEWALQVGRVLKPDGSFFLNIGKGLCDRGATPPQARPNTALRVAGLCRWHCVARRSKIPADILPPRALRQLQIPGNAPVPDLRDGFLI